MISKTKYKTIGHDNYEVIVVDKKGEETVIGRVFKKLGENKWKFKPYFKLAKEQIMYIIKEHHSFVEAGRTLSKLWENSLFFNFFDGELL